MDRYSRSRKIFGVWVEGECGIKRYFLKTKPPEEILLTRLGSEWVCCVDAPCSKVSGRVDIIIIIMFLFLFLFFLAVLIYHSKQRRGGGFAIIQK